MRITSLLLLFTVTVFSSEAFATDYTVSKTADASDGVCDADCSLREGIIAANAQPGPDRIILGSSLSYTLTLGPADASGALTPGSGDLDVIDTLTIDGNGSTIDAAGLDRVFDIQGSFTVTINDLTMSNGVARGFLSLGGGLNAVLANLILNGSTVTGNSTADESGSRDDGGGIAVVGSFDATTGTTTLAGLTLNSSVVSGNTGLNGGGIVCVLCTLAISQSSVSLNTATGGDGGGIDMVGNSSTLSMTSSAMASNAVSGGSAQGGGLSIPFGTSTATLSRDRIVSNTGTTGSAIYTAVGTVTASDNWWGCNYGPSAGGVGCTGLTNGVSGSVSTSPYLILKIAAPAQLPAGTGSAVTADLTYNSVDADTSSGGTVPDGTSAVFSGTLGTFDTPSSPTMNGKAGDVYTAGNAEGTGSLSTTVDAQTVSTTILITAPSPGTTRRRSQTISI
jgi:CSLREA domain-containing protein